MNEIKCPHCGEVFTVDEAGYAEIVRQVRASEFTAEVKAQTDAIHRTLKAEQEKALTEAESRYNQNLADKQREIIRLQTQAENAKHDKQHAVDAAVQAKNEEIIRLQGQLEQSQQKLEAQAEKAATIQQLAVSNAVNDRDKKILQLQNDLEHARTDRELHDKEVSERHQRELKLKDEEIERYRDFRQRQSTKMLGENLEQHCLISFNQVRTMAFPNAYFEKDNDVVEGTKGDFVYREELEPGVPLLSIMFEMKNEAEATDFSAKKKTNESHLEKLDKDRKKKKCEYAVLVSTLEPDNEYYNMGIVQAYQYEKMYVIRPQFFITMISLLRNGALASAETKRELAIAQRQNLDVQQFEQAMLDFKNKFNHNYDLASRQFKSAIDEIDKTIEHLQKVKDNLTRSSNNLRLANEKAQDLSIKKLTNGNPTMRAKFEEIGADIS